MSIVGAEFVVGIRMMSEWFLPKEVGTATGLYGGWGNSGDAFSAIALPTFATATAYLYGGQFNWRLPIALTGIASAIYGVIYYFIVQDTPPGQEYWRPRPTKLGLEVTSRRDFWLSLLLNLPMVGALGVFAWRLSNVKILSPTALDATWVALIGLYGLQTYAARNCQSRCVERQTALSTERALRVWSSCSVAAYLFCQYWFGSISGVYATDFYPAAVTATKFSFKLLALLD